MTYPIYPGEPDYIDDNLAKALAHPTRAQIFAEANERILSPSQFATRHDLDLPNVAYHFRELANRYKCLELVAAVPTKGKGATQHFYKATRRALFDGKAWEDLPEGVKNKMSGRTLTHLLEAIAEAMLHETFDERSDRALAWEKLVLDEQGFVEVANIMREAIYKAMRAKEAAEARLSKTDEANIMLASWAFLFFKSPFTEPKPYGEENPL